MAIESKNLLTVIKAYARANALPLDYTEVWSSLEEAQAYLKNPTAYAGQTIKAKVGNEYKTYTIQGEGTNLTLKQVGAVESSQLKQYVQIVTELPTNGEQGVVYVNTTNNTGSIWTGSKYTQVFKEVTTDLANMKKELQDNIDKKAPIDNPVFTGKVTLAADPSTNLEAATKQYVDKLIAGLNSVSPGIVDTTDNPLPTTGYKVGQMFRVAAAGTYAGNKCEIGDLIIVLKDHAEGASNDDFMVVQANIDGAVTGPATATNLNIAVFDGVTGKVIKDSGVTVVSLNDAISKAHSHANKTVLDSYDKSQTDLLAAALTAAQTEDAKISAEVEKKANKATTLEGYGITDAYTTTVIDNKVKTINDSINLKADTTSVDTKIAESKTATLKEAATAADTAISTKVGDIGENTVKDYVDGKETSLTTAIGTAKTEAVTSANSYTDTAKKALSDDIDGMLSKFKTTSDEGTVSYVDVKDYIAGQIAATKTEINNSNSIVEF